MSTTQITEQSPAEPPTDDASRLGRRAFLEASLKGVGIGAAGAAGLGGWTLAGSAAAATVAAADDTWSSAASSSAAQPQTIRVSIDPETAVDTWSEPWVWRPWDWPSGQLHLTLVENAAPVAVTGSGFENVRPLLFSYGGITPGPTIRMYGDDILKVNLRNLLGLDQGFTAVGPNPDLGALPPGVDPSDVMVESHPDWCLGEHTNGLHSAHVTNLHTHGLHVRPGLNPDGTVSDNIILRIMPQADFRAREESGPDCRFLRVNEQVGEANYEFRLGNVGGTGAPHPPGTHWYHPHAHGATHNQVASGMAGFLIIEGDVDAAVNQELSGTPDPDPQQPTGRFNYRERLMLIQRVNPGLTAQDPDAPGGGRTGPTFPTVNGSYLPKVLVMSPGAIERWRILNGSVDGRGFVRVMVLRGEVSLCDNGQLGVTEGSGTCRPLDTVEIEARKVSLYQLAMDGVTLVRETAGGGAEYFVKNLNFPAPPNPLDLASTDTAQTRIEKIAACYADAASIRAAYVRPNEVPLAPANRTDVFFAAPTDGGSDGVYTIVAQFDILHNENYEKGLRQRVAKGDESLPDWPGDTILGVVVVKGDPVEGGAIDLNRLPPVPNYLLPVYDDEVQIKDAAEAAARVTEVGAYRTRTVIYSGWGNADFPLLDVPREALTQRPELFNLTYGPLQPAGSQLVVLPPAIRSMAIDGRKFDPTDPEHPRMLLDTAEEWVLYNDSLSLWHDTTASPWSGHVPGSPVTRSTAAQRGLGLISTTSVDHPFHIHTNPCWVSRIEVAAADGSLVNILDEPRWQDVVWIPRNRGRVVFRSRFWDFLGEFVNHCHILQHEDNGMMQLVEVVPGLADTNYQPSAAVSQPGMTPDQVTAIYPRPTLDEAFHQNARFVDANPATGQDFPGVEYS
jgi:FtsP/CotA-like multicopper oxidase with cupredoxin domain